MVKQKSELQVEYHVKRKWYYAVGSIITAIVVLTTSYMLMLPAITMEREPVCGIEEHVHDESCYSVDGEYALICEKEEHVHSDLCYSEESITDDEEIIDDDENLNEDVIIANDIIAVDENSENSEDLENSEEFMSGVAEIVDEDYEDNQVSFGDTTGLIQNSEKKADNMLILSDEGTDDEKTITSITLSYKCPDIADMTDWAEVTDDVALHGDDALQLYIKYDNVHISDVKNSGYKMYYPLPDWMQEVDDSQTVDMLGSDLKVIGTISTENGYLVANFDKTWLDSQPASALVLKGNLSMEATLSTDYIKQDTVKLGSITIHIDYTAGEWESKYGTLEVEKSDAQYIEQDDGYDILQYTLTVHTGGDSMSDVYVKDAFSDTSTSLHIADMIEEIVGVTETETAISDDINGLVETSSLENFEHGKISYADETIIWNIGDMQSNETRTLTYQVRLKSKYTGLYHSSPLVFLNLATVYSNDNEHNTASTQFDAQASTSMSKNVLEYTTDADGIGGTIIYAIRVASNSSNNYTLDNLQIFDYYMNSYGGIANSSLVPDSDSFYLYDGDATTVSNRDALDNAGKKTKLSKDNFTITPTANGAFRQMLCSIGDLKPGEVKTLVYTVRVPDFWYTVFNGSFDATNFAALYDDTTKTNITPKDNGKCVNSCRTKDVFTYSMWEEKYNAVQQTKSETIQMNGNVYEKANTLSDVSSFDINAGDYKYRVIVNQYGDVDIHEVELKDTLGNYMQYTGYLRIDEYDTLRDETLVDSSLSPLDPGELTEPILRTAWLKIDSTSSFKLSLADLGFSGQNAYVLTYYTKVTYTGNDLYVSVNNSFSMTGNIYAGTTKYVLSGLKVSVTTKAVTSYSFQTEKLFWYYTMDTMDDTTKWEDGALYWYVKISGSEIPENAVLKDVVNDTNHGLVDSDSLVGIYIANSSLELSTIEDLQANSTEMDRRYYNIDWNTDNNEVSVSFPELYNIPEGYTIYMVIKTKVLNYPSINETVTYQNTLWKKTDDTTGFQQVGDTAEKSITGATTASKTATNIFTYDGSQYVRLGGTSSANNGYWGNYAIAGLKVNTPKYQIIQEAGTYIEYTISSCKNGTLSGNVEFSDTLPEGLELVHLRNSYYNGGSFTPQADCVEIEELENNPDWTRYQTGNKLYSNATSECIYYYNSTTREIRWKLSNVKVSSGGNIEFQLICRVVDEDVLLGAKQGEYTNTVVVTRNGKFVENASSGTVQIGRNALSKNINGSSHGSVIPFKITVNEIGEDLLSDSDEITLVDEMSSSLTVDIPTISVTDKNGNKVDNVKIAIEKTEDITYLRLTIPDNMKLIITYDTKVNSLPNQAVSISNVAHWEGYDPNPSTEVENKTFSYSLSGMAEVSGHASLKLTKRDADDIMQTLSDAVYSVQEAQLNDDGTFTLIGDVHTGTTDINGEIYFSADESNWMEYDKIYCITEIQAPDGYLLDDTPQYILLATKTNTETYPSSVEVQRNSSQYVFDVVDTAKPRYKLPEAGGMGTRSIYFIGFSLITISAGYIYISKRREF